jgi:hypothetical protein
VPSTGVFFAFQRGLHGVEADAGPVRLQQKPLGQRLGIRGHCHGAAFHLLASFVEHADDRLFSGDFLAGDFRHDGDGRGFKVRLAD